MLSRLLTYGSFVRFSHSVFALPFALTGVLLAGRVQPVTARQIVWIVAAMVFGRSAALGFNRVADARFDAVNPRTAARELPRGALSRREAVVFVIAASAAFVFSTFQLSWLCFALSPVALAIVFWYSLAKRFTWTTQLFLGLAMAVAPVGGFDVLYACQDVTVDRVHGLRSIPARFGVPRSVAISRGMHLGAVASLAALALVAPLGWLYPVGVAAVAALLWYEQSLVSPDDLSQVKRAFDLNGYVGILYFVFTALSLYVA